MLELEEKKKQEIKHMVTILEQIDLPDILLLTRDANTLLIRQREAEKMEKKAGQEVETQEMRRMNFTYEELVCLNEMISVALMSGKVEFDEVSESVHKKVTNEIVRRNEKQFITSE